LREIEVTPGNPAASIVTENRLNFQAKSIETPNAAKKYGKANKK
jgi:hypothetical protein